MKTFRFLPFSIIILALFFSSCNNEPPVEDTPFKIEDGAYYGIGKVPNDDYYKIDSVRFVLNYWDDVANEYASIVLGSSPCMGGEFLIYLPASLDNKHLKNVRLWSEYKSEAPASDLDAKVLLDGLRFIAYKSGKIIGSAQPQGYFIYADRAFNIKGEFVKYETYIYDLTFRKGWNVYYYDNYYEGRYVRRYFTKQKDELTWYFSGGY